MPSAFRADHGKTCWMWELTHQIFSPMKNHEKFGGIRIRNDFTMQNEALVRKIMTGLSEIGSSLPVCGSSTKNFWHSPYESWKWCWQKLRILWIFANLPSKHCGRMVINHDIFGHNLVVSQMQLQSTRPFCLASWWRNPTWWCQPPRIPGCFFMENRHGETTRSRESLFRLFPLPPKPDLSILSWEWLGGWLVTSP